MDEAERQLIHRARKGDTWAFEQLVSRYDRLILGLALDMAGEAEEAQDVYQETMLAAYRGLPKFRMESEFSTWLYRIGINQAHRHRRRRLRRRELAERAEQEERGMSDSPERELMEAELREELEKALEELSEREQVAFLLCHRQGMKIRKAAEVMDCSAGAVKSYLFRGREKVKGFLKGYMEC